jgi:hypothetical protein
MQFKELLQLPGAREDSAELVTEVLSNGWIFAIYIIAFVALCFISHTDFGAHFKPWAGTTQNG